MSAILDLCGAYLDHLLRALDGLYHYAKFGYDRCCSFDNMNVSVFGVFGWKTPIHPIPPPKKNWVLGLFDPLKGLQYQSNPKMHTLQESGRLSHQA